MRGTFISLSSLVCFAAACSLTTDLPEPGNSTPVAEDAEDAPNCNPDDALACTADSCDGGTAVHQPLDVGTDCAEDGGSWCDGQGRCVECLEDSACMDHPGCASEACICVAGDCKLERCTNGVPDADESDVDCGGAVCDPCADGQMCVLGADCASKVCDDAGKCAVPTCEDEVANGNESDVDCGGDCNDCVPGKACHDATDCDSEVCASTTLKCAEPKCDDDVKNGVETAIDCGGSACDGCGPGEACRFTSDCADPYYCADNACQVVTQVYGH